MEQKLYTAPAAATDTEVTIATPRFDSEAAQSARPVVPFSSSETQNLSFNPLRAASRFRNNRSWPLSIVIISALVGGVVGGLGLGLYQQRRRAETVPAATTAASQQAASPVASVPQLLPAPTPVDADQSLTSSVAVEVAEKPVNAIRKPEPSGTTTIDPRTMRNDPKSGTAGDTPPAASTPRRPTTGSAGGSIDPSTIQRPRRSQPSPQAEREKPEPERAESRPESKSKPRTIETSRADDEPEQRRGAADRVGEVIESQQRRSDVIESKPQRREQPRRSGTIAEIFEGSLPQ